VVSRVLQNSPHVSPERREAVQKAIQELGYRPNGTARSLSRRRTQAVGVLINDLRQPWFVDFLEGLTGALHDSGLHTFLGDGRLDRSADERLLQAFMEMPVDGLVLAGTMPGSATITEAAALLPRTDVVAQDDALGVVLAMDHLYGLGHRRIGYIAGPDAEIFAIRRDSYLRWMTAHGLQDHVRIAECDTTEASGYAAGRELLDAEVEQRPTAIHAANDLSFVGFDNSFLARMQHVGLTSVDVAPREVGTMAAARLLERIADPSLAARQHLVTPTLDVRRSTAEPG
jgi:DNA-binding LacI/PurR family transcriptional regulator